MAPSPAITVKIDLSRVRQNARQLRDRCGVPILATIKADAYGLGAIEISEAIADLVEGFCVFRLREAIGARLHERTGRRVLTFGPPESLEADDHLRHGVCPAVSNVVQATALRDCNPVLCLDTGMQRFACRPADAAEVIHAGHIHEAFTHATNERQLAIFLQTLGGLGLRLHAAGSSMLETPEARLDAVRPGFALYRSAVRVSTPLVEARDTNGPLGYTALHAIRHGVILGGYACGLAPGPCLVNGRPARLIECGMQSSYVELDPRDRAGDEVVLLGDELDEKAIAATWQVTPHQALLRLAGSGIRTYSR